MAFDDRDPSDLKLHVLLLLLGHPQGINFGDFSGAFHQLHGYHPHISLYGYSSLRQLIADMKDLVVVEGSSGTPVMKLIKGFTLDLWLEEENGLQSSEGEPQCLINGEKAEQHPVDLADVLVALTNLLAEYKLGLRITKLQEFLLAKDGIDLEKFSISRGYEDTLEFLEAQMPELNILYQENRVKCVVQLMADASASSASASIQNLVEEPAIQAPALSEVLEAVFKLLVKYRLGLKIKKLQELLLAEDGVDLEKFSISHGNKDTLEFLEAQMPELHIHYKGNRLSCVVQLPAEGRSDILAAVSNLLAKYKLGLKIKKLQELLLAGDGIDLKKISISHGYKDTLEFLESQMPELHIQYKANRLSCLVQLPTEGLSDTLAAVTNILAKYKLGLKIKKVQELLLAGDGVDLEKISVSHGYKDTLEFLKAQMPELNIQYKENHLSCVVKLPAGISVCSASFSVQNCGEEPAGQPPVPCIPVPSLESGSSACSSNPAPSGQVRPKSGTSSPAPCLGTVFPTCNSDAVSQKRMEMKSDVTASSAQDDIQNCMALPRRQAPELSVAFFLIRDILQGQPHGLKVKKLKKALNKNYKFNLETFCSDLGYKDVMSCLQDISGLLFRNVSKHRNCVVQLESRACSPAPSLDSDFSACSSDTTPSGLTRPEFGASSLPLRPDFCALNADAMPQKILATSSGLADVLVALTNLLAAYKSGLRITKLQEFLLARDGVDLEKFSISHGYKDTLEFLEAQMTDLSIHYREDRLNSVIQLAAGARSAVPSRHSDFSASSSNTEDSGLMRQTSEPASALMPVLRVLQDHPLGLTVKALEEVLEETHGFNLETFSQEMGYADVVTCLLTMPGICFFFANGKHPHDSVVQLLSFCRGPPHLPPGANSSSDNPLPSAGTNLLSQESIEAKSAPTPSCSSTSSQFSVPPSFELKQSTNTSQTLNQNRSRKKQARSRSASSTSSTSLSVDTEHIASRSNNQTGNMLRKIPDVLALVNNLLAMYVSGLKVKKVQEFLLAVEGFDLEKFSITHGYKDSLEFLEYQMPQLTFRYGQNRLSCVVKNGSGCGDNAKPLSTSCNSSANKAQDQSLPLSASPAVENGVHKSISVAWPPILPSFEKPCSTSHAKIGNSHQHLCPGPAQPPKACQLNGPLPPDKVSSQVDIEVPRISSLIKDQPPKDLEEVKQQVAHILATHPKGMSLFQFRAAYSATYQQHLPLGNASSVKQCLLGMPDVVQLKGCGVQTLLLPVSSAALPAKSGLPASSTVEETPTVPGHMLPTATAVEEAPVALKPIPLSKALEVPQHYPVSFLPPDHCREPGDQEACILPGDQLPTALKTTNPWQERQRARPNAEDISGQPDSSRVEKATVDPAISFPKASLVGAPKSCLKLSAPNTAAMPTPQPRHSLLQASDLRGQKNCKKCSSFSQPLPQKAPLPVYPVQEYVRTSSKPACISFPPQSPVVFPTTTTSWDENLKPSSLDPKSTRLTNPWSLSNSAPATFVPQPVSDSFQAWPQPVVYPPITFLSEIPDHPVIYPTSIFPAPVNPSQIQFPKTTLQSHPHAPKIAPEKPAQVISSIHSTAQWTYIPAVPHSNTISQVPEPSRTLPPTAVVFPAGWPPLSSPSTNTANSSSAKSQAVYQPACSNQDSLQGFSPPVADEKLPDTTLEGVTSKSPSPTYPRRCHNADSIVTSLSTLPISFHSLSSTKAAVEPPYASSSIKNNSNSPLEPPTFLNQQQFSSRSTAIATSDMIPIGSPPSLLDLTTSPHDQLLHPSSSISSNSDVRFSAPQSFIDPQPGTRVSAVGTESSTQPLSSPPCPVGSTSSPSHQPSSAAWRDGIDYGAFDQKNAMPTVFNQTGSPSGPLPREQTLHDSSPPNSPPPQNFDKCVIL